MSYRAPTEFLKQRRFISKSFRYSIDLCGLHGYIADIAETRRWRLCFEINTSELSTGIWGLEDHDLSTNYSTHEHSAVDEP